MSRQDRWSWFSTLQQQTRRLKPTSRAPNRGFAQSRRLHVEALEDRRLLAVFSVSNLDDAGAGSLREAITLANANGETDTIDFATIDFSVPGTIGLASQLPTITEGLTITGPGQDLLTLDAGDGADNTFATGDGYRIFDIDDGDSNNDIDVEISGLTLTGGDAAKGVWVLGDEDGEDGEDGGAIRTRESLTLLDSNVSGNAAGDGGGVEGGDGGDGGGIFSFGGGTLTITGSTISGNTTGDGEDNFVNYPDSNGGSGGKGGGIFSFGGGTLTITGSTISGNTTGDGGVAWGNYGVNGSGGEGGGIFSSGSSALTIAGSTISGNSTEGFRAEGGGIFSQGAVTLTSSTVSGNSTEGDQSEGGGIFSQGDVTLTSSTVSGNSTTGSHAYGGGIFSDGDITLTSSTVGGNNTTGFLAHGGGIYSVGDITLTSSTVSENSTIGFTAIGGGTFSRGGITLTSSTVSGNSTAGKDAIGGGIFPFYDVMLTNSTVSGNSTAGKAADGGGIRSYYGAVTLTSSTVSDNHATYYNAAGGGIRNDNTIVITNSIVASNTAGGTGPDILSVSGSTLDIDYSLIGNTSGSGITAGTGTANLLDIDPLLGPLADNGGPTLTHALLAGSPALDAGDPSIAFNATEFDQRGAPFARVAGGRIDIGAFELQNVPSTNSADFDTDGDIDGADFLAWQRGFGTPNANKPDGDADNDNDVDADDLVVWSNQFGQPPTVAAASAPLASESVTETSLPENLLPANLIDAALATAWLDSIADVEETAFLADDASALEVVFAGVDPIVSLSAIPATNSLPEFEEASTQEDEAIDEPWLADELLEQVFG